MAKIDTLFKKFFPLGLLYTPYLPPPAMGSLVGLENTQKSCVLRLSLVNVVSAVVKWSLSSFACAQVRNE